MNRRLTRIAAAVFTALTMLGAALGSASAQEVTLPYCAQLHTVAHGETLFRIARSYGVTVAQLQRTNGINNANRIYAGQTLCIQGASNPGTPGNPTGTVYVVQTGDTLARIARRFGVDMTVLARVNGIVNVNHIFAGQTLNIPDFTIQ